MIALRNKMLRLTLSIVIVTATSNSCLEISSEATNSDFEDSEKMSGPNVKMDSLGRYSGVVRFENLFCSGTIVSRKHILSTAHCLDGRIGQPIKLLIENRKDNQPNLALQGNIILHPKFDSDSFTLDFPHANNIAVVELDEELSETEASELIIPVSIYSNNSFSETVGIYVSFSRYYIDSSFSIQRAFGSTVIDNCKDGVSPRGVSLNYPWMGICDTPEGNDTTISPREFIGGPLVVLDEQENPTLIGVTNHRWRYDSDWPYNKWQMTTQINQHFDFLNDVAPEIMQTAFEHESLKNQK